MHTPYYDSTLNEKITATRSVLQPSRTPTVTKPFQLIDHILYNSMIGNVALIIVNPFYLIIILKR